MSNRKAVTAIGAEAQPKSVGIWIRVSTEDQAQGESPEHHEKRARYYAESREWKVRAVYHLEGVSGKAVLEHPEAKRMMADIEKGHITGLIFSKLARLARSTRHLLDLADFFRLHDADLVSLGEAIDTSTPAGRLFYTMIAAMAQWEREEIASRVAASVPIRAKLGKSLGGVAPYGYRYVGKELVSNPKEAPIRKLMFEMFLEHRRIKRIARLLNEMGHRTRNGSRFSDNTVERLLRDPIAKGQRRANYTQSTGDGKHWTLKPKEEWVFTEIEPIVSTDLWDQVNGILEGRKQTNRVPAKKPIHLFAGVVFCTCGGKMVVPSNSPKYICQQCKAKIPTVDLEAVFQEQLRHFFFSPADIATYLSRADDTIKGKEDLLRTMGAEEQRTRREMDRVMRLYLDDRLPQEAVSAQYRPLFERVKQLEDEIPALQGEVDFLKIQRLSTDEILTEARDLYSRWEGLSPGDKRQIIEQITERITIGREEVHIRLCYLPTPAPKGNGPSGSNTPNSPANSSGSTGAGGPTSAFRSGNDGTLGPQPCPCGFLGDPQKECACNPLHVHRYRARVSGPLLDRIDIQVEVPAVRFKELTDRNDGEPSEVIRGRVERARQVQHQRFAGRTIFCNAEMTSRDLRRYAQLEPSAEKLLEQAMERLCLSARAYTRILKVARTLADLESAAMIGAAHIAEAIQYRSLDRAFH